MDFEAAEEMTMRWRETLSHASFVLGCCYMVFGCGYIAYFLFIREPTPVPQSTIDKNCWQMIEEHTCREYYANINHRIRMQTDKQYRREYDEQTDRLFWAAIEANRR